MILRATHTHLYPGHRGTISGAVRIADLKKTRDCLVEFVDGSAASANISADGANWLLRVDAYRTAAGTEIPVKRWRLRLHEDGDELQFRVLATATNA